MNVFSDGGGGGVIKSASFTWDSTIDGNLTNPTTTAILGQLGTAGKMIAVLRATLQRENIVLNLGGPFAPNQYELYIKADATNLFYVNATLPPGSGDDMITDGTAFSIALPTPPLIATGITGGSDVELTLMSIPQDPADTWNVTGKYVVTVEYLEQD